MSDNNNTKQSKAIFTEQKSNQISTHNSKPKAKVYQRKATQAQSSSNLVETATKMNVNSIPFIPVKKTNQFFYRDNQAVQSCPLTQETLNCLE